MPRPQGDRSSVDRREFLKRSAGLAAFAGAAACLRAEDRPLVDQTGSAKPPVNAPRATSGDKKAEPHWDEQLTITVGPEKADLVGADDKVLQAAVDFVARYGGGTVKVNPGTYKLRNAVTLNSNVRILGSGLDSILIKEPSITTKLAADSDWFDQEITLENAKGFSVGDGICLRTKNPHNGGTEIAKRTLIARSGNRFKLDKALRQNFWLMGNTTVSTLFPILTGELIDNIVIENITLDGNKDHNENLDGNYAGCIFLQDCHTVQFKKVTARNYNGDGISWQICHDVTAEGCHSHDHSGLGLHPGSGSQRPTILGNVCEGNDIGIFFCWGVKYGLAEKNRCDGNRGSGISIGHRDNFNIIRDNDVSNSGKVGILFRPERGQAFAPHRNRVENNRIINSGGDDGVAIDVQGTTSDIELWKNELKENRAPAKRIGVRLGAETGKVDLSENTIVGFSTALSDLRKA